MHRSSAQKTTASFEVQTRATRNAINDTEVEVQRRQMASWKAGLQHRQYIGPATLDVGISYQRGTRWFGAQPAPEERFDEATALSRILRTDARLSLPFTLGGQTFRYDVAWQRQTSATPLTSQERFSIGGRYTVRGFDGERTLSADRGWLVRNDLSWQTPLPGMLFYLAADYGEVGGKGTDTLVGNHLAGGAAGVRGRVQQISYDLSAGVPFSRPDGFKTSPVTFGFSLSVEI